MLEHELNQGQFTRFVLKLGPEYSKWIPEGPSLQKRVNNLISIYDQWPDRKVDGGLFLADVIVETAAARVSRAVPFWRTSEEPHPFSLALAVDGFLLQDGAVHATMPTAVTISTTTDELTMLLAKHRFEMPLGHLRQGLEAHSRGDWAAANSQIRTFFEGFLDELATCVDGSATTIPKGHPRRQHLAALGFLNRELNEWNDDGKGFINGLMRRLHPHGSHPGLSDEADSTFRLQSVLLISRLLLLRLERGPV